MKEKLKVGVIGGGPAGSMVAYLLSLDGHDVTLFEKQKALSRKLCGEYLCPKGVELLENLGLKETLCSQFLPLSGMILSSPQGVVVQCTFPQIEKAWSGISLNRQQFDQNLLNLAITKNVKVKLGFNIKEVLKIKKGWQLLSDSFEEFDCDLLVAADGRVSPIAKKLKHSGKLNTSRVAIHFYLPRIAHKDLRYGEMHIFNDGTYCGIDPISDEEVNVSFVVDAKKIRSKNLHQLCQGYFQQSPRLVEMFGNLPLNIELKTVSPLKNINNFVAGNSLAYVGDASGFIDPLTGEGIYNAILSAHLLADSIRMEQNLENALKIYKKNKKKIQLQKKFLNTAFQSVIKSPILCKLIAGFIQKKKKRADFFIGIIGNIDTPLKGIVKMLLT